MKGREGKGKKNEELTRRETEERGRESEGKREIKSGKRSKRGKAVRIKTEIQ